MEGVESHCHGTSKEGAGARAAQGKGASGRGEEHRDVRLCCHVEGASRQLRAGDAEGKTATSESMKEPKRRAKIIRTTTKKSMLTEERAPSACCAARPPEPWQKGTAPIQQKQRSAGRR